MMGLFKRTSAPQLGRLSSGGRINRDAPLTFAIEGKGQGRIAVDPATG